MLRDAGATVVDPAGIPTAAQLEPRSLAELIECNRAHADRELRYVRQDGLETVNELEFTEEEYREALAVNHRLSREEGIRR